MAKKLKLCIFDLDDTLIDSESLYQDARRSFYAEMVRLGFDLDEAKALHRDIHARNVRDHGVTLDVFPNDLVQPYEELCAIHGKEVDPAVSNFLFAEGFEVFSAYATRYPYAINTLQHVQSRGYITAILTRGVLRVQLRRLLDASLADFFDQIFVVPKKQPETFDRILRYYDISQNEAIMIGNSIIGDINPALEAGLFAIWAPNGTYEVERSCRIAPATELDNIKLFQCKDITGVPVILDRIELDG